MNNDINNKWDGSINNICKINKKIKYNETNVSLKHWRKSKNEEKWKKVNANIEKGMGNKMETRKKNNNVKKRSSFKIFV